MSFLAKFSVHLVVGPQGFDESHFVWFPSNGNMDDVMAQPTRRYCALRRPFLGKDAYIEGVTISQVDPSLVTGAGNITAAKKPKYIRNAFLDTGEQVVGIGDSAVNASNPWATIFGRLFFQPDSTHSRGWTMRGAQIADVPYPDDRPLAPGMPSAGFRTAFNALKNYLATSGTQGLLWGGLVTPIIDPPPPTQFPITMVEVDPVDVTRTFRYTIGGAPVLALGDWVHLSGVRGPGLTGASGWSQIITIDGQTITTRLTQAEPCDIFYIPNSAKLIFLRWGFRQYKDAQYERTEIHKTGRPKGVTKGRVKGRGGKMVFQPPV